jgi:hypothetical protein
MTPILLALLASATAAQQPRISSAYTKLDLDACSRLDKGDEPQSAEWRCSGYAGLGLFVQNGDDRYDLDAGTQDEDALWSDAFDYPGDTVEWRLNNGRPFAIIYRLRTADPERAAQSWLIVESVGSGTRAGCRVAKISGSTAKPNEQARKVADALLRTVPKCLKPE